ncbi:uncharacterized protein LOC114350187 [Ostrinia furnacalis]|uniref:uncharacterized protein LOC114350187 n=1 Tax=Ostrinia furnacalis TaxID=93504 RepID=UPI00103D5443|nr:uncharacterized protein LOC114350187 [Ostrinia furnacalis]
MGSAKVSNAQPQISMAENDKKTLKKLLKVFFKKDKKKDKPSEDAVKTEKQRDGNVNSIPVNTVANILDKIQYKLEVKNENEDEDDELNNFSFKTVQEEARNDRIDSQSSEDSGFAEKYVEEVPSDDDCKEKDDDVILSLKKLNLDDKNTDKDDGIVDAFNNLDINNEKCPLSVKNDGDDETVDKSEASNKNEDVENQKCTKEKRKHKVLLCRKPIKTKVGEPRNACPYYVQQSDPCRQIQINKHTLTGGQVIVNQTRHNDSIEFDNALIQVQQSSQNSQHEYGDEWINIVSDVIENDMKKVSQTKETDEDLLSCFFQSQQLPEPVDVNVMTPPHQEQSPPNPIEEFSNHLNYELFGELDFTTLLPSEMPQPKAQQFLFPTPPHSENAASPMSDSQGSFRTSEYTYSPDRSVIFSPERSSPICNSDYEKFQDISNFDDSPIQDEVVRGRERTNSLSMTMKQYKDLQKELSQSFSKKDCCQMTLKPCKALFQEHLQKLKTDERKNLCLKVAKMELKHAYGVLQHVLIRLSQPCSQEALLHALFCLLGERVLSQEPDWFQDDFGLNLLKSAVLRCPQRPLLTRYLVQCVRTAVRVNPALTEGKDSVFHEVDAQGDTLVTACARRGDSCADALAELVRRDDATLLPLFRIHHVNADGSSALHVACSEHSASRPRLHIAHVLLEHAGADLWQGDSKAGDTPVHMAVNSKDCDLKLIMVLFKHVDRKVWKKLAHTPNMCSTTPLEYARSATKSQVRDGYPTEVLEFLKKCR